MTLLLTFSEDGPFALGGGLPFKKSLYTAPLLLTFSEDGPLALGGLPLSGACFLGDKIERRVKRGGMVVAREREGPPQVSGHPPLPPAASEKVAKGVPFATFSEAAGGRGECPET